MCSRRCKLDLLPLCLSLRRSRALACVMDPEATARQKKKRMNALQHFAYVGDIRYTQALLSRGQIDVNERTDGCDFAPLALAAERGHEPIVKILLHHGARVSTTTNSGSTPLILSAQHGYLAVVRALMDSGARLDARDVEGVTALHAAASDGHLPVVQALSKAGADPDTCSNLGGTPLYDATFSGHIDVVRELLRLRVRPACTRRQSDGGSRVALDVAAQKGFTQAVREFLRLGIDACGGETRGQMALHMAAKYQHVGIMAMLCDAGVVDTGRPVVEMGKVLCDAVDMGRSRSVKFLLEREWPAHEGSYVDCVNDYRCTPLIIGTSAAHPKVVRLLVDAGADVTAGRSMSFVNGVVVHYEQPLAMVERELDWRSHRQRRATDEEMHRMEAIRRMLLRVDSIRAGSWLWGSCARGVSAVAEGGNGGDGGRGGRCARSGGPRSIAPIVRTRWAAGGHALVATMFR